MNNNINNINNNNNINFKNIIQSEDNQQFKKIKRLFNEHSYRQKNQQSILEGMHLIQQWQQWQQFKNSENNIENLTYILTYIISEDFNEELAETSIDFSKTIILNKKLWAQLTPLQANKEALAIIQTPNLLLNKTKILNNDLKNLFKKHNKILILEGVQDAGNLGAIIRTAAAAGYCLIIQIAGAQAYHPKVLRAAMGGHTLLEIYQMQPSDLNLFLEILATQAPMHQILLTDLDAANNLFQINIPKQHIWVFGSEGQGVSAIWRQNVKNLIGVKIPQMQAIESLNVGHACAICLYEGLRKT